MATDFSKVDKLVDQALKAGLASLGKDIQNRAIVLAPKDTGALRQSARTDVGNDRVTVSFNTAYARRRHWENNLHPATKKYLTNALKSITSLSKYFKRFN